jgi:L-arabinose isomerase
MNFWQKIKRYIKLGKLVETAFSFGTAVADSQIDETIENIVNAIKEKKIDLTPENVEAFAYVLNIASEQGIVELAEFLKREIAENQAENSNF